MSHYMHPRHQLFIDMMKGIAQAFKWVWKKVFIIIVLLFTVEGSFCQILIEYKIDEKGDSIVSIKDSVKVQQGNDDSVKVFFILSANKKKWDFYKASRTDIEAFQTVSNIITYKAESQIANRLSFIPMKRQIIMYFSRKKKDSFVCLYKCYGRNGYGNLIETEVLVDYEFKK